MPKKKRKYDSKGILRKQPKCIKFCYSATHIQLNYYYSASILYFLWDIRWLSYVQFTANIHHKSCIFLRDMLFSVRPNKLPHFKKPFSRCPITCKWHSFCNVRHRRPWIKTAVFKCIWSMSTNNANQLCSTKKNTTPCLKKRTNKKRCILYKKTEIYLATKF